MKWIKKNPGVETLCYDDTEADIVWAANAANRKYAKSLGAAFMPMSRERGVIMRRVKNENRSAAQAR